MSDESREQPRSPEELPAPELALEPPTGESHAENNPQQSNPAAESADPAREPEAVLAGEQRPVDPKDADDVLTKRLKADRPGDADVLAESRSHTRRSFLVAGAAAAAGTGFFHWLGDGPSDEDTDNFLRKALGFNAGVSRDVFRDHALAPTYPLGRAENLRINGVYGLKKELKTEHWRLQLVGMRDAERDPRYTKDVTAWEYRYGAENNGDKGHDTKVDPSKVAQDTNAGAAGKSGPTANDTTYGSKQDGTSAKGSAADMAPAKMQAQAQADENKSDDYDSNEPDANGTGRTSRGNEEAGESDSTLKPNTPGLLLQLADITKLPRHELVTQFKCIEGWSQIVHWAGVRMADFLDLYPPAPIDGKDPLYVYMETPDGDYYTGYDMHVMRHPQTLLVTEMMGEPLTQFHGAPLRLHMPTKYGYKQIKRIGLIAYTNDRPDDYWTKLGYDWYAGL